MKLTSARGFLSCDWARSLLRLAIVPSVLIFGTSQADAAGDPVKIGIVAPMSGTNSRYGAYAWEGAQLAAKEINAQGGVQGHMIQLIQGDSQCVPAEGVSATQRLIRFDHVSAIIGDVCSSVTLAMQPIAESAKVILLNAASSNPDITYLAGVGGFKWTFRNYPTDENRALIALQYAAEKKGYKRVVSLAVDSDYGRGAITYTKKYLKRFGVQLLSEDYYQESETDFRPFLNRVLHSNAQAIIFYGQADSTPIIARQMMELGMAGKVALVGNGEFSTASTIAAAPSVMNGAVEAAAWIPEWPDARSQKFVADFQAANPGQVANIQAYSPWETLHLLATAMQQAPSLSNDAVRQTLAGIHYQGAMGPVSFDDHQQAELPMILIEVENGKPVIKGAFSSKIDYASH